MTVVLSNDREVTLSAVDNMTLSGEYTVQRGDDTPDLTVKSTKSATIIGRF